MAVDAGLIGRRTGAWRVAFDRSVLANVAAAVGDTRTVCRSSGVPLPPTFTFSAPSDASGIRCAPR